MKITQDGFVWLILTPKAKEVFASGLFSIYALYDDDSEDEITCEKSLNKALENGLDIAIEVGHIADCIEQHKTLKP